MFSWAETVTGFVDNAMSDRSATQSMDRSAPTGLTCLQPVLRFMRSFRCSGPCSNRIDLWTVRRTQYGHGSCRSANRDIFALAALYRYGPSRRRPRWRWVTPGSILTSVIWLAASVLFSWYVTNLGDYNETYGALGAVIIFMTWFWLPTTVVLIGAELNAETERQSAKDADMLLRD